jgi:hypothetical protein
MMKRAVYSLLIIPFLLVIVKGDIIHLKDGRKFEGKIISQSEKEIRLKMKY